MLVQTKPKDDAKASDVEFESRHPKSGTHVQRLASRQSQVVTVHFNGQLSEFQTEKESIRGGHPTTIAIKNDFAEVLLGLFVPWDQLSSLFQQYASAYDSKQDACSMIWNIVEPTLPPRIRNFAQNVDLLRKSKKDIELDAALRARDPIDHDINDMDPFDADEDMEESETPNLLHHEFSTETLISACHSIAKSWHNEGLTASQRIPSLLSKSNQIQLHPRNFSPLDILQHISSGLQYVPGATLEQWKLQIKGIMTPGDVDDMELEEEHSALETSDLDVDSHGGTLYPTLNSLQDTPNLADLRSQVGDNPSGASLTELVKTDIPLNKKQGLIVEKVLSGALAWEDYPYDASKREQMLLYVGGEGGVGKSQVIKGIVAGLDLISRKDEVILLAPTGAAADHIGGNTIHTTLGIGIGNNPKKKQNPSVSPRVKNLWSNKTIMIIDEVSMVDLSMLNTINNQCKIAKSLDRSSPDLFGGLPIVIFMGDFYQFPPISGPAFWKGPRSGNDDDLDGWMIWQRFKDVVILDEQMRQAQDPEFQRLLGRARTGTLTNEDLDFLNQKVVTSLFTPELDESTIIVKSNALRHHINRLELEHFARSRKQRVYIFPAQHNRVTSVSSSDLRVEHLLQQPDEGAKVPFPGLFFYTPGIPTTILANISTPIGQVNGARGTASGISVDPTGMYPSGRLLD